MEILGYKAVFEQAADGWWYAYVPDLPLVHCNGRNRAETESLVRYSIACQIEELGKQRLLIDNAMAVPSN